jgi:hypothetical protein
MHKDSFLARSDLRQLRFFIDDKTVFFFYAVARHGVAPRHAPKGRDDALLRMARVDSRGVEGSKAEVHVARGR